MIYLSIFVHELLNILVKMMVFHVELSISIFFVAQLTSCRDWMMIFHVELSITVFFGANLAYFHALFRLTFDFTLLQLFVELNLLRKLNYQRFLTRLHPSVSIIRIVFIIDQSGGVRLLLAFNHNVVVLDIFMFEKLLQVLDILQKANAGVTLARPEQAGDQLSAGPAPVHDISATDQ